MTSTFNKLCFELSSQAAPALAAAGYDGPSTFHSRETRYDFRRPCKNGHHVVSILFDKYRRPNFSVQVYFEPAQGIDSLVSFGGTLLIGTVAPTYRPWPFAWSNFRAERPMWLRLFFGKATIEAQIVRRFIDLLPEIESWWSIQNSTRHILVGRVIYQGTSGDA